LHASKKQHLLSQGCFLGSSQERTKGLSSYDIVSSHLILLALAQKETLPPRAQLGDAALRAKSSSRSRLGSRNTSSSSSFSAPSPYFAPSSGVQGSGSERSSFQWSPSGRRTGSLYCRVGIGFHLQIHPDGHVNGSHQGSILTDRGSNSHILLLCILPTDRLSPTLVSLQLSLLMSS
uniref:Fibroblast growth factor 5 n=1 Tax=Podarcis muralis TaxID=64176 RepID=A0A670KHL0_PODMU